MIHKRPIKGMYHQPYSLQSLQATIKNHGANKKTISMSDKIKDLGLDSLDATELLLDIEGRFGVVIPDSELARMRTVADLDRYLVDKTGNNKKASFGLSIAKNIKGNKNGQ